MAVRYEIIASSGGAECKIIRSGRGSLGQVKKGGLFGRSIVLKDAKDKRIRFNKGSLIDCLKHQHGMKLKKGILGCGMSKDSEVRAAFNEVFSVEISPNDNGRLRPQVPKIYLGGDCPISIINAHTTPEEFFALCKTKNSYQLKHATSGPRTGLEEGFNALSKAVYCGNIALVKALLEKAPY